MKMRFVFLSRRKRAARAAAKEKDDVPTLVETKAQGKAELLPDITITRKPSEDGFSFSKECPSDYVQDDQCSTASDTAHSSVSSVTAPSIGELCGLHEEEELSADKVVKASIGQEPDDCQSIISRATPISLRDVKQGSDEISVDMSTRTAEGNDAINRYMDGHAPPVDLQTAMIMRDLLQDEHGQEHPLVAQTQNIIGRLYHDQGEYVEACRTFKESIFSCDEGIHFAQTFFNLGRSYNKQKKYAEAIDFFMQSLKTYEHYIVSLGVDRRRQCAEVHYNLGLAYQSRGSLRQALRSYEEALELYEQFEEYPVKNIAKTLNALGVVFLERMNTEAALACHTKALDLLERHKLNSKKSRLWSKTQRLIKQTAEAKTKSFSIRTRQTNRFRS
jgi:tetratricopeptide (TPR) repeat protein